MAESGQSSNSTNSTNSTDYLTIEELVLEFTPSQTDILVAIIYFGIAIFSTILNIYACGLVWGNDRIAKAVKMFLFGDHLCRALNCTLVLYFGTCILNRFCLLDPWWLICQILAAFQGCLHYSAFLYEIVLSTNRFYAVAFMGIYYKKTLQLRYIQMIIVPILPVTLMTIGTFIPGNCRFFNPLDYAVLNYGDFFTTMIPTLNFFVFSLLCISIGLDVFTLRILRIRLGQAFKSQHGGNFTRSDLQLTKQMVATHGSGLFYLFISFFHQYGPAKLTVQPIISFTANMAIPLCFSCWIGLLTIFFMTKKNKSTPQTETPNFFKAPSTTKTAVPTKRITLVKA